MALPVLVTPVAPAGEQNAPDVTVAWTAGAVVLGAAVVVFGAAVVTFVAAVVVAAAEAAGEDVVAALDGETLSVVLDRVATGDGVATLVRAVATLALANAGTCGAGAVVRGFATAPTAARLRAAPATTPTLTLPLNPLHRAVRLRGGVGALGAP